MTVTSQKLSMEVCQRRLAIIWLSGAALAYILFSIQGARTYTDQHAAWSWFLPMINPTVLVIVGSVFRIGQHPDKRPMVPAFAYRVAQGISLFYLAVLLITIAHAPMSKSPLDALQSSSIRLGVLQALVSIAIGSFFGSVAHEN